MRKTKVAGLGMYVPEKVVTNNDLVEILDTSDEWIKERTGIKERRYINRSEESTATMGVRAATIAIERAGLTPQDIDFIIFATLSPDYFFPGCGVLLQRSMDMKDIGALDVRNQCSGFVYGLSIADQFIKTGMYKHILLIGAEVHSAGLDFSKKGRNVSVIFGDGAGAVVLQPAGREGQGILSTHLHSNGKNAELLSMMNPGFHGGVHKQQKLKTPHQPFGGTFIPEEIKENHDFFPSMDGPTVFKNAVEKMPEVIMEALEANSLKTSDLNLVIPHQANLRISQFIQHKMKLRDDQMFNNIQKYGNTTAASIPIAWCEAWEQGRVNDGNLICLVTFGSGFTWGSALLRW